MCSCEASLPLGLAPNEKTDDQKISEDKTILVVEHDMKFHEHHYPEK